MRATFEEACELSKSLITAEKLRSDVKACLEEHRKALAEIGWTLQELVDESGRRMRARVDAMQGEGKD